MRLALGFVFRVTLSVKDLAGPAVLPLDHVRHGAGKGSTEIFYSFSLVTEPVWVDAAK